MSCSRKKKPAASFTPAPAVAKSARALIKQFHPELIEHDVHLEYAFRSDTPKVKGRVVSAAVRKESALAAFWGRRTDDEVLKPFFAIVVSEPSWCSMSAKRRLAVIDHCLCHCGAKLDGEGNVQLFLRRHDVEEFAGVIERHGLYNADVRKIAKAIESAPQTALDLESE